MAREITPTPESRAKDEPRPGESQGGSRPPAIEKGALRDQRDGVRGELRDPTRSKPRRKPTVAQRAARDRAGNRLTAASRSPKERAQATYPAARALATARSVARELGRPASDERKGDQGARHIEGADSLRERMDRLPRSLSLEAAAAIRDVGRFRVVRVEALERFHSAPGQEAAHKLEIAHLKAAGLVSEVRPARGDQAYLTLTREGQRLAQRLADPGQRVYSGAKKPREMRHDAAVYEAFQVARRDLEAQGSRVVSVRLDYQMKEELRREAWDQAYERAKADGRNLKALPKEDQLARIKAEAAPIARLQDLPVDEDGGVEYPDLQIEYERPGGEIAHCNVEVITENYKDSQIEAKQAAGFQCFSVDVTRDSRGGTPRAPIRSLAEELLSF